VARQDHGVATARPRHQLTGDIPALQAIKVEGELPRHHPYCLIACPWFTKSEGEPQKVITCIQSMLAICSQAVPPAW
jgi:hypothetical protein